MSDTSDSCIPQCLIKPINYQRIHMHRIQMPCTHNHVEVDRFFIFIFLTREGFTTIVANEGLEKARAYLNQVPRDRRLMSWFHVAK